MRPLKTIAVVAVPLALVLSALPAHAASVTVADAKGDVRVISHHDAEHQQKQRAAPARPQIADHDIVRTRFAHTRKQLIVTTKFRSLRGPKVMVSSELTIRTPKRVYDYLWMRSASGADDWLQTRRGEAVECRVQVTANIRKATRTIRIPRRCLDNPAWVRVTSRAAIANDEHIRFDSAHGKRAVGGMTKKLRAG